MTRDGGATALDTRVALLFAAVFAVVVGLTNALLVMNMRAVETGRGLAALRQDAALAASLAARPGTPDEQVERIEAVAVGKFDGWSVRLQGGTVAREVGLAVLGVDPEELGDRSAEPTTRHLGWRTGTGVSRDLWVAWVPIEDGGLLAVSDLSESREAIRSFAIQLWLLSGLIAAVGFWAMLLVGASLTRPIRILTAAAAKVAHGELDTRARLGRTDEIGTLGATFDHMAQRIQENEESRRRFLSSASHELKTPLASVKALVEALMTGEDSAEDLRTSLVLVDREIDRLSSLVRSLMARSRLEGMVPAMAPVALRDVVERTTALTAAMAAERGSVVRDAVGEGETVAADSAMLDELLLNLLDNAIRHGGHGTIITVEVTRAEGRRSLVVRNTGVTIPADALPRLFEPFATVDASRSRELGGGGLGLSIVRRIAELHGWRVGVSSGEGLTVFSLDLGETGG